MGARVWRVTTPEELQRALKKARSETRTCAIVIETEAHRYGPDSEVWWDVAPAQVSNDPAIQRARSEYEAERDRAQRFYY